METSSFWFMCLGKWLCTGRSATSLCPQSSQSPRRQSHNDRCLRLKEALSRPQRILLLLLSLFSCVRLCDPIDSSPPGSAIPGILQARTLDWVAISFSNAWKWKVKGKSLSRVRLLATPWTTAYQAPPSMGFSRQEYWSGGHRLLHQSILAPFILLQKVAPSALLGSKVQKHYIPPAPSIGPISPLIPRSFYNFKSSFCFRIKQNLLSISMYTNTCSYRSQHSGSANNKILRSNGSSTISTLNGHGLKLCL